MVQHKKLILVRHKKLILVQHEKRIEGRYGNSDGKTGSIA